MHAGPLFRFFGGYRELLLNCILKNLALIISKFCFCSIDFYITFLKKKKKNKKRCFLSKEHNLSLPPHILKVIQYETLWSVLFDILPIHITCKIIHYYKAEKRRKKK